ncbi:hypothetical protein MMC11_003536 [Xylographa trunciseda]|nr:hypothetical protein [Xylographa trunciseda]
MTSFVLHCTICPKRPDFSDLSHLLTHVGSKGHLSHYFKAQVRSRQEQSVREQLLAYDQWYQKNQIERLLSQRMVLKESKGAQNRNRTSSNKQPRSNKTTNRLLSDLRASLTPQNRQKDDVVLDPQLSRGFLDASVRSPKDSKPLLLNSPVETRAYVVPRMQSWAASNREKTGSPFTTTPERRRFPASTDFEYQDANNAVADEESLMESPFRSMYPEPPGLLLPTAFQQNEQTYQTSRGHSVDGVSVGSAGMGTDDNEELEDKASECTKLKGICWPGMDIFDSASPDTRRRRNQKKDGTVLEQMKANSEEVEPTELIFYSGGQLKKRRYITGQVESSPVKEDTPKPTRQRSKSKRVPLSHISNNAGRTGRSNHVIRSTVEPIRPSTKAQRLAKQDAHSKKLSSVGTQVSNRNKSPNLEDDEVEWSLMMGELQHNKRRAFEIYDEEPTKRQDLRQVRSMDRSLDEMYPFLQDKHGNVDVYPLPHGLPELDSRNDFNPTTTAPILQQKSKPLPVRKAKGSHGTSSGHWAPRILGNKENIEPLVDQTGRIDDTTAPFNAERSTQRYFAMSGGNNPQYYTNMPQHWGFTPLQPPQNHGFGLNPLAFNFGGSSQAPQFYSQFPSAMSSLPNLNSSYTATGNESLTVNNAQESDDETVDDGNEDHSMFLCGEDI